MTMDELREWGSTVTAEELARAIDTLPPAPLVSGLRICNVTPEYPYAPVFLPPSLYDAAEREGFDLRGCVKQQPIPLIGRPRKS